MGAKGLSKGLGALGLKGLKLNYYSTVLQQFTKYYNPFHLYAPESPGSLCCKIKE